LAQLHQEQEEPVNQIVPWVQEHLGIAEATQTRILASLAAILIIWVVRLVVVTVLSRQFTDVRTIYRTQKIANYAAGTLALLIVGRIWFEGVQSLATFLGLLTAGLAIALRDPIVNLAGWLFILWRRPFEVGDRIELGRFQGDVIDVRLFQFTVLEIGNWVAADQSTGRVVHVPNGLVFTESTANYSKGFRYIWNELPVLLTFESNWRRAKGLLLDIAHRHADHSSAEAEGGIKEAARKFMIFYSKLTPIVYTDVRESGVLLTIRYLCKPRERRGSAEAIWEEVLETFARNRDIEFAYPTQRFFNRAEETPPEKLNE